MACACLKWTSGIIMVGGCVALFFGLIWECNHTLLKATIVPSNHGGMIMNFSFALTIPGLGMYWIGMLLWNAVSESDGWLNVGITGSFGLMCVTHLVRVYSIGNQMASEIFMYLFMVAATFCIGKWQSGHSKNIYTVILSFLTMLMGCLSVSCSPRFGKPLLITSASLGLLTVLVTVFYKARKSETYTNETLPLLPTVETINTL